MSRLLQEPWLNEYVKYVADTGAPDNFKLWSGIAAISATLKKRVQVKRAKINVYANQYIILVGPPGIGKGEAMNPALDLVKEAGTAHFIEDRATCEGIEDVLAKGFPATQNMGGVAIMGQDHCAFGIAPELSVFLGASDWSLQFLCTLWDKNEFSYTTKHGGVSRIKDNCFGLFGACTPDYIRKLNKDSFAAIAGGFTSRGIFVFSNKKGRNDAFPADIDQTIKDKLVNDLRDMAQNNGEMSWHKEARDLFIDFYDTIHKNYDEFESEVLMNFRARMWSHVVKNAMVLSLSEANDLIIKEHHMKTAIKLITDIFNNLETVFSGVGEHQLVAVTDRILRYIRDKKMVTRTQLLRHNMRYVDDELLTKVLFTLTAIGAITTSEKNRQFIYMYNSSFEQQGATNGNP